MGLFSVAIRSACFLPTTKARTSNNVFPFFVGMGWGNSANVRLKARVSVQHIVFLPRAVVYVLKFQFSSNGPGLAGLVGLIAARDLL